MKLIGRGRRSIADIVAPISRIVAELHEHAANCGADSDQRLVESERLAQESRNLAQEAAEATALARNYSSLVSPDDSRSTRIAAE